MTATSHMPLVERLRKGANCVGFLDGAPQPAADVAEMLRLAADRIEQCEDALQRITQWVDAYPITIFREPTAEECRLASELLKGSGTSLDALSASMGRHCLKGVGGIARAALAATP